MSNHIFCREYILRALVIAVLALVLSAAGPALAAGGGAPVSNRVALAELTLPGDEQFAQIRLTCELVVREGEELAADVTMVEGMRRRIIGRIVEALSIEKPIRRNAKAADVQRLKQRLRDLANTALGAPLVQDVLIVRLLVS